MGPSRDSDWDMSPNLSSRSSKGLCKGGSRTLSEFVIVGLDLTQGVALGWELANAFGVGQSSM
jgi:hypothetical protein